MLPIMPFMQKNMNKANLWFSKREKKGKTPTVCQILKRETIKIKKNKKFKSAE